MTRSVRRLAAVLAVVALAAMLPVPCPCPRAPESSSEHACCAPPTGVSPADHGCCDETPPARDSAPAPAAPDVVSSSSAVSSPLAFVFPSGRVAPPEAVPDHSQPPRVLRI